MELQRASAQDLDTIFRIVRDTVRDTYAEPDYPSGVVDFFLMLHSREQIRQDLETCPHWLLLDGTAPVGTGCVKGDHISRVYILPGHQGRGGGALLMDRLERELFHAHNTAWLDPSRQAIPFYEKRGYTLVSHEDGVLPNGVPLAHDVMKKERPQ